MNFKELLYMAQTLESKGKVQEAWDTYMEILFAKELVDRYGEGYFELAGFLLRNKCNEEALSMFVNAFELNYNQQEILSIIDENYCKISIETLKETYRKNVDILQHRYPNLSIKIFEELPLKFILVEKKTVSIYDVANNKFIKSLPITSAVNTEVANGIFMFRNEYDIDVLQKYSEFAQEKNMPIYFIYDEFEMFLSYLQVLDFSEVFKNSCVNIFFTLTDFICYLDQNKDSLPNRVVNANPVDKYIDFICDVQENNYESNLLEKAVPVLNLSAEAINGLKSPWLEHSDDILLSFCIPTYNRGQRALENVKHILKLAYQQEIEVVICDNNSVDADGAYRELSLLTDTRVRYYKNNENIKFCGNFMKIIQLARGKYVYIISDEDFVNLNCVPKLLDRLKMEENLAIIRGAIAPKDPNLPPANSFTIHKDNRYHKGLDAFGLYGLTNNYISGTIYNRDYIVEGKLFEPVINNLAEHDAYPHLYLEALLCTQGDVQLLSEVLCLEGRSEGTQQALSTGVYAYESRLKQHKAFVHILNEVFEMLHCDDMTQKINYYLKICQGIFRLVMVINGPYYIEDGQNINVILNNVYYHCLKATNESFGNSKVIMLLEEEVTKIYNQYR